MFCTKCGKEIADDSKFCCFCGNKLEQIEVSNNSETHEINFAVDKTAKEDSSFNKIGIIVLVVILLLTCVIGIYNPSSTDKSQIQSTGAQSNSVAVNEQNYVNENSNNLNYQQEQYISSSTIYNNKLKPLFENLSANLKSNDVLYNDKIFYNFQQDFSKIVNEMNETGVDNIFEEDACYGNKIVEGNKNLYNQMKIFITTNECGYIFNPNWEQLQSNYGKFLSPTYNNWLSYLERNKKIFEDAGLIIEVDKLRENIICLEKILANNNFVAQNDVKNTLNFMVEVYLTGIDNTPVFSYDNDTLKPDFKSSYEKFIAENQESNYYSIVKQYYDMLKNNNFKKSDKIESWIRSQIQ